MPVPPSLPLRKLKCSAPLKMNQVTLFLLISTAFFTRYHVWHIHNYQAVIKLTESALSPWHLNNVVEVESCINFSHINLTQCHNCIILWLWQAILRKVVIMQMTRRHKCNTWQVSHAHTHTMCSQTKLDSHVEPISLTGESCGAKRTVTHLLLLYLPAADRPG